MKTRLLLALVWLPWAGCQEGVKEPACMAGYDSHITYVDSIKSHRGSYFLTTYGVCHISDFWGEYPIEIKKMNLLDNVLSGKSTPWIIDHEKAHRFEAIQREEHPNDWMEFENLWVEQFGSYDPENFADTYADLRRAGIKTPRQRLIYDFMIKSKIVL